jgi:cell division septal protein FtsQ
MTVQTKTKLMIGLGIVLSVIGILIFVVMSSASSFYMTVDEVVLESANKVLVGCKAANMRF